jgi:hypothetical protein
VLCHAELVEAWATIVPRRCFDKLSMTEGRFSVR